MVAIADEYLVDSEWYPATRCSGARRWMLLLPSGQQGAFIEHLELLSDPGPQWLPDAHLDDHTRVQTDGDTASADPINSNNAKLSTTQPPFYTARDSRLVVLMATFADDHNLDLPSYTVKFSMLASRLLQSVDVDITPSNNAPLQWAEWGPTCTRAEPVNMIWDGAWPVCVHGTRMVAQNFAVFYRHPTAQLGFLYPTTSVRYRAVNKSFRSYEFSDFWVEVIDFDQAALRKAVLNAGIVPSSQTIDEFFASQEPVDYREVSPLTLDDGFEYYLHPTRLPRDFSKFFEEPETIYTSLPYRVCKAKRLLNSRNASLRVDHLEAVMLSEDSIVIVNVRIHYVQIDAPISDL